VLDFEPAYIPFVIHDCARMYERRKGAAAQERIAAFTARKGPGPR
jgi:hypothetical protein